MLAAPTLFEFQHDYPINNDSFSLPGLGRSGLTCGVNRMSHFSADGSKVKYSPLSCGRIECPKCWTDWARRVVFSLALRIEAYARANKIRPTTCIFSVRARTVLKEGWTWDRITDGLFRRGYRRSKKVGVNGGLAIFHPYRIKPSVKLELKRGGERRDVGMWKIIRARVNAGEPLSKFTDLGPHIHAIIFGEPQEHASKDFLIRFNSEEGIPRKLNTTKEVVAFLFYLITHTGVLNHLRQYPSGVHRRATHTVRSFGVLHRLDPTKILGTIDFALLASEIADLIGMKWAESGLVYPASSKEFDTPDDTIEWIPIFKLNSYLSKDSWLNSLHLDQQKFWFAVLKFMMLNRRPPDLGNLQDEPSIAVYTVSPDAIESFK